MSAQRKAVRKELEVICGKCIKEYAGKVIDSLDEDEAHRMADQIQSLAYVARCASSTGFPDCMPKATLPKMDELTKSTDKCNTESEAAKEASTVKSFLEISQDDDHINKLDDFAAENDFVSLLEVDSNAKEFSCW